MYLMAFLLPSIAIRQDDKDLVHEFVRNDGLACLIKVGSEADQNYQNYILRGKRQLFSLFLSLIAYCRRA